MPTPDQNMLTPSKISVKPNVMPLVVPEYDFEGQSRWDIFGMAGNFTVNSIQTFDSKGQPHDAQNDNND
jgi:hypothetical protein